MKTQVNRAAYTIEKHKQSKHDYEHSIHLEQRKARRLTIAARRPNEQAFILPITLIASTTLKLLGQLNIAADFIETTEQL
jgi:hypothetical protein